MEGLTERADEAATIVEQTLHSIVAYLPTLLAALALLVAGWLLARLGRRIVAALSERLTRTLARLFAGTRLENIRLSERTRVVLGDITFVVIIIVFIAAAVRVADIPAFSAWLNQLVSYLPQLAAGAIIMVIGVLVGMLAKDLAASALPKADQQRRLLFARALQYSVIAIAFVMAIGQVGIDATMLVALVVIASSGLALGLSIAFGLGARNHVENLLAARRAREICEIGQDVQFGRHQGRLAQITATALIIDKEGERTVIPARLIDEAELVLTVDAPPHD